jgi:hypothetical protein
MPPVGFETKISAGGRPQTSDIDRAATGAGSFVGFIYIYIYMYVCICINNKYLKSDVNVEAFAAIQLKLIFSGRQPRKDVKFFSGISGTNSVPAP